MRLALCMIVRDNAAIIEECLMSVRPWVDEMVVIDTGSMDGTKELAAGMGARVDSFPWVDDFSAARNASIAISRSEWIFWMDSDDVIDEHNGKKLRQLANGMHNPETLGYVMQVHCPGPGGLPAGDVTVVDHIKMFRNHSAIRFEGRIHEQILPSIRRVGGNVAWTDIFVTHKHGAVTDSSKARKHARDLRILELDLAERIEHPFVLFNLGMTYADMQRPLVAVNFLERSIRSAGPNESHLPKAYALLAACYLQVADIPNASRICQVALRLFPSDPELIFRAAVLAQQDNRSQDAIELYRKLLNKSHANEKFVACFSSRDAGIVGHKARHNLAIVLAEVGELAQAELEWRLALAEAPCFEPGLAALGQILLRQNKLATAKSTAEHWLKSEQTALAGTLLLAALAEEEGAIPDAIDILREASGIHSERLEPLEELGRLLFATGRMEEAEQVLSNLVDLRPEDASAAHNLGATYLALGRIREAEVWLRRSIELRPQSKATADLLIQLQASPEIDANLER